MLERLTPEIDQLIREQMATGQYASENDLIAQAIQALRWQEREVAAIQVGIDDMEAGRVVPLREFDRDFRTRHRVPPEE